MPDAFLFRCPQCRTRNRIPADRVGAPGRCGKCGGRLHTEELRKPQPVMVSDASFEELVLGSPLPVLIDCWAPWCSACKTLAPVVEQLARELRGRVRVAKLNVEQNPLLATRFDMRSIPVLLIFDAGRLRDQIVGAAPREMILQRLAPFI